MDRDLVLVVDDDDETQALIRSALDELDLEVYQVKDGQQALAKAFDLLPSLLLLDMALPGMDGLEVARTLKSHVETREIPIIVLSALGVTGERALALGCDGYLGKPLGVDELKATVKACLSRRQLSEVI